MCWLDTDDFSQHNQQDMTWKSFWRSVGHDLEHAANGVASFATHVVDKTASVVENLGGDVVKVAHEGSTAASSIGSSLAMPMTIGAVGFAAYFLMIKQR